MKLRTMKLNIVILTIFILLLGGCVQQDKSSQPAITTTTTTAPAEDPIINIKGVPTEKLKRFLGLYMTEVGIENIYRYWEAGMDLPQKTEPDEYDGQWLDFNNHEYFYYYFNKDNVLTKDSYNWEKNLGSIADCQYEYKSKTITGNCESFENSTNLEDEFKEIKRFYESFIGHIKMVLI